MIKTNVSASGTGATPKSKSVMDIIEDADGPFSDDFFTRDWQQIETSSDVPESSTSNSESLDAEADALAKAWDVEETPVDQGLMIDQNQLAVFDTCIKDIEKMPKAEQNKFWSDNTDLLSLKDFITVGRYSPLNPTNVKEVDETVKEWLEIYQARINVKPDLALEPVTSEDMVESKSNTVFTVPSQEEADDLYAMAWSEEPIPTPVSALEKEIPVVRDPGQALTTADIAQSQNNSHDVPAYKPHVDLETETPSFEEQAATPVLPEVQISTVEDPEQKFAKDLQNFLTAHRSKVHTESGYNGAVTIPSFTTPSQKSVLEAIKVARQEAKEAEKLVQKPLASLARSTVKVNWSESEVEEAFDRIFDEKNIPATIETEAPEVQANVKTEYSKKKISNIPDFVSEPPTDIKTSAIPGVVQETALRDNSESAENVVEHFEEVTVAEAFPYIMGKRVSVPQAETTENSSEALFKEKKTVVVAALQPAAAKRFSARAGVALGAGVLALVGVAAGAMYHFMPANDNKSETLTANVTVNKAQPSTEKKPTAPQAGEQSVRFGYSASWLTDSAKASLKKYADDIVSGRVSCESIVVKGNVSPKGDPESNKQLAGNRANGAAEFLKDALAGTNVKVSAQNAGIQNTIPPENAQRAVVQCVANDVAQNDAQAGSSLGGKVEVAAAQTFNKIASVKTGFFARVANIFTKVSTGPSLTRKNDANLDLPVFHETAYTPKPSPKAWSVSMTANKVKLNLPEFGKI